MPDLDPTTSYPPGLVPDHECEIILDLTPYLDDGRSWTVGKIVRPPEGFENERWCMHVRTPLKPEIAFCMNEADFNFLVVAAYAALGYHTNPEWVENLAKGTINRLEAEWKEGEDG